MENTGGRQVSRPSGQRRTSEEEDAPSPLVEIPEKIKRHQRRRRERREKHNAHYLIAAIPVARNLFLSINYSYFISVIQYSGESGCS